MLQSVKTFNKMVKVLSENEIDRLDWENLAQKSSVSSFFQTEECYEFYRGLSFFKPFLFGVAENGELVGLVCGYLIADGNIFKRFFSRRAIIPGGLLLSEHIGEEALSVLLQHLQKELHRRAIYIEIRNYNDYSRFNSVIEQSGFKYHSHLNFHVDTLDVEQSLKNLNSTKRRDVKISKKEGAEIVDTKDIKDASAYYEILSDLYKTKIKTPLFPFEFFEKAIKNIDNAHLFVVKYNGKVIGGSMCMAFANQKLYEWFVCGLDGSFKNIYPSTLATWAAIEYAAANGFKYFDMMGAGRPDEGYGVREFKSKFGGRIVEHGRFLFVCKPFLYAFGKYMLQKIKKTK